MAPPPPKGTGRGFADIAYHKFIRTDGTIEDGRKLETVGAHCEGYNKTSIGICLNGLKIEDFKEVQFLALENVLKELKPLFPNATIHPHSELEWHGKSCPVFGVGRFVSFWASLPS